MQMRIEYIGGYERALSLLSIVLMSSVSNMNITAYNHHEYSLSLNP